MELATLRNGRERGAGLEGRHEGQLAVVASLVGASGVEECEDVVSQMGRRFGGRSRGDPSRIRRRWRSDLTEMTEFGSEWNGHERLERA